MGNKAQTLVLNEDEKRIKLLSTLLVNKIFVLEKLTYNIHTASREIDVNEHMNIKMEKLKTDLDTLLHQIGSFQINNLTL
jgi:hypothetical protein